jgi:hypothetical protein
VLTAAALVAAELFVELFFVAVAAALFVAAAVADGVTLCVVAGVDAAGAAGAAPPPGNAIGDDCVEVNVGGVTAKTAPNPPTVPVAINNARFISVPSLTCL